jgi:arsenate reductase
MYPNATAMLSATSGCVSMKRLNASVERSPSVPLPGGGPARAVLCGRRRSEPCSSPRLLCSTIRLATSRFGAFFPFHWSGALRENCGIEYLKCPPTRLLLTQLLDRAGLTVRQILREKVTPFHDLGLGDLSLSDDALLDAIGAHPILMNRPLVVTPKGVRLCRPSEKVLELLPPQRGQFIKEDGERVINDAGRRVARV